MFTKESSNSQISLSTVQMPKNFSDCSNAQKDLSMLHLFKTVCRLWESNVAAECCSTSEVLCELWTVNKLFRPWWRCTTSCIVYSDSPKKLLSGNRFSNKAHLFLHPDACAMWGWELRAWSVLNGHTKWFRKNFIYEYKVSCQESKSGNVWERLKGRVSDLWTCLISLNLKQQWLVVTHTRATRAIDLFLVIDSCDWSVSGAIVLWY